MLICILDDSDPVPDRRLCRRIERGHIVMYMVDVATGSARLRVWSTFILTYEFSSVERAYDVLEQLDQCSQMAQGELRYLFPREK